MAASEEKKNKISAPAVAAKLPQRGRLAGRLPKNLISRLQYRELGGLHRHHRQSVAVQTFHKLPGRLGFCLRALVHESVLREGHVFLGFSKNGQFVLSYTLHLEADDHTAYPVYIYRLQWWHFLPYRRLRKVSEVRLFGEEEIQEDLLLTVCEWPDLDSKLVVHGYCNPSDNEEKRQCYVTVTAVPPVGLCVDCSHLATVQAQCGITRGAHDAPARCLAHSFTAHTRYELAPPYPSFAPTVFLKFPGVVVVNTGDSLVALSVMIERGGGGSTGGAGTNGGATWGGMCSPRVAPSESWMSGAEGGDDSPPTTASSPQSPPFGPGEILLDEDPLGLNCDNASPPFWSQTSPAPTAAATLKDAKSTPSYSRDRRCSGGLLGPSGGGVAPAAADSPGYSSPGWCSHRSPYAGLEGLRDRHGTNGKENQGFGSPRAPSLADSPCFSPCAAAAASCPPADSVSTLRIHNSAATEASAGFQASAGIGSGCFEVSRRSPAPSSQIEGGSRARELKSALDVYNFEGGGTPKKDEDDCFDGLAWGGGARAVTRATGSRETSAASTDDDLSSLDEFETKRSDGRTSDDVTSDRPCSVFEKPVGPFPRLQVRADGVTIVPQRLLPNLGSSGGSGGASELYIIRGAAGGGGGVSPGGYGARGWLLDQGGEGSTCSSCISSSPVVLQNESKCFTYSMRRYVEAVVGAGGSGGGRPESPVDMEDDLNLAYHTLLPLEVHGANYCSMKLLTNQSFPPLTPCVAVKQLTLDIEHYLGEAVKTSAAWGHRYLAFTDYDVQILEVCPDTAEVTAFVFVLIRARAPKDPHTRPHSSGNRSVPKLYDTGFKLAWNLQTGSYKTLGVKELVEVNQAELLRSKQWHHPTRHNFDRICDALHQRCAIPALHHQLVHVLTNEAVFKGHSLKMLIDRQYYSAILL